MYVAMRAALPVRIAGTASFQPGPAYRTAELAERVTPRRDPADAVARTGITSRHFAAPESRAVDLGGEALRAALASAALRPDALRRLIFVSSVGGDQIAPANANLIAAGLGLSGSCDCFDLNNACMGFLTALDLGARSVATGVGPVAIVVVELLSRYTTPEDPRPYLVLADAVAAVVLVNAGLTGRRETFRFAGSNQQIHEHALAAIRRSADAVLTEAGIGLDAIDWVLPHQPNGSMLAAIMRELALDPARVVQLVDVVGSVGAASIATSLDRLLRGGRARPGDQVLMVGVGAGISYGAALLRLGS
jgi:3-oxoacyl-[acyl-carrier-protein] synthase III